MSEHKRSFVLDVGERCIGREPDDGVAAPIADMIAAKCALCNRDAIAVRRTHPDGYARQSGHRFKHADYLRRPKNPIKITISRCKIGNPYSTAPMIGEKRRYGRGVAQIFRLGLDHPVEHNVGKALSSLPETSRQNTGLPSKRMHHQTIRPFRSMSAHRPFPMMARSSP